MKKDINEKLKLNLSSLKVQSFVTSLSIDERNKYKGGGTVDCDKPTYQPGCSLVTCIPICTNTGGGCTGLPECCN